MALRLYHFLNQQFGIEAVLKKRLKISRIAELNDPFELIGLKLNDRKERLVWKKTKKDFSKTHGVVCMSESWSNPLLWSHYADRHRGLCLGFDVSEAVFRKVQYRKDRIPLDELGITTLADFQQEHMITVLHTKYEDWKYEGEHRAYTDIKDVDPSSGLPFVPFSKNLVLKEIILGVSSGLSRDELQTLTTRFKYQIDCMKARLAFKAFGVTMQKNRSLW